MRIPFLTVLPLFVLLCSSSESQPPFMVSICRKTSNIMLCFSGKALQRTENPASSSHSLGCRRRLSGKVKASSRRLADAPDRTDMKALPVLTHCVNRQNRSITAERPHPDMNPTDLQRAPLFDLQAYQGRTSDR
ncbi:hypothetical protein FQA47_020888 [Oryzias melastigma]|uniref:Secreted protein n=1 Tax=Oryzias melastigma TaxID=30732 RepID=A0A834F163_ORYME|nr:hypothetical protein FQA47_020888 [Oryzias melastigma]